MLSEKPEDILSEDPLIFHCFSGENNGIGDGFHTESRRFLNNPADKSKLVESVVGMHLKRYFGACYYWQGKQEIDFVTGRDNRFNFIEVKYLEQVRFSDFKWLKTVLPKSAELLVITKHHLREESGIRMIPASLAIFVLCISTKS